MPTAVEPVERGGALAGAPPQRGEESQVDGLVGLAAVETVDAVGVRGSDRPDVGDGAVAQDDVDEQQDEQVDEQDEEDDDEQVEPNAMSAKST